MMMMINRNIVPQRQNYIKFHTFWETLFHVDGQGWPAEYQTTTDYCYCLCLSSPEVEAKSILLKTPCTLDTRPRGPNPRKPSPPWRLSTRTCLLWHQKYHVSFQKWEAASSPTHEPHDNYEPQQWPERHISLQVEWCSYIGDNQQLSHWI